MLNDISCEMHSIEDKFEELRAKRKGDLDLNIRINMQLNEHVVNCTDLINTNILQTNLLEMQIGNLMALSRLDSNDLSNYSSNFDLTSTVA